MVSVAAVAGAVITTLFTLVAVATPSDGVTSEGEVACTIEPEPVVVQGPIELKPDNDVVL
jgi:hypothetical protein